MIDVHVKSASRALELLDLISRRPDGATFSDILASTGYPKGSLHALLGTLTKSGWLRLRTDTKLYSLGFHAWQVGAAYASAVNWEARAREIMAKLRDRIGETVQLAVLDGMEALYIAKVEGWHNLRLDSYVGQRLDAHATAVGKLLLAAQPPEHVQRWLSGKVLQSYTATTITKPEALLAELARIRAYGYATDSEERTLGARCVATGIADATGRIVAALSVSSPSVRFGAQQQADALPFLKETAAELSATLGTELALVVDNR